MTTTPNPTAEPTISSASIHYGLPTVWLAGDFHTTDRQGQPVVVDHFVTAEFSDGHIDHHYTTASGFRFRKDGELANRRDHNLQVVLPANVAAAFETLGEVVR